MKLFTEDAIQTAPGLQPWFDCAMISTCRPIFDACFDNHDVEQVLRKAGVIGRHDQTDTESCALVVNFRTVSEGHAFVRRLNRYLARKVGIDQPASCSARGFPRRFSCPDCGSSASAAGLVCRACRRGITERETQRP